MSSRQHYFAITNAHGWRLAIQASRVGVPPFSAAPPTDASSLVGGFPLIARGQAPRGVAGAEGPALALELVAARIPRGALRPAPGAPGASLLLLPLPLGAVRRVHFQTAIERAEFLAGLAVLEEELPKVPGSVVSPSLFSDPWPAMESPAGDVLELGRKWQRNLDRQARVSAAILVGTKAADVDDWDDPCIEALRSYASDMDCGHERVLAKALARIDAIRGWAADDLLASLASLRDGAGHALADFAQAWVASQDPFGDGAPVEPSSDSHVALELLLGAQGLSPRQLSDELVKQAKLRGAPRAGALAALILGRHLLPRDLRPHVRDLTLADEEIAATARVLRPPAKPRVARRSRSGMGQSPGLFDLSPW
jgi:hypothetical protein